MMLRSTARRCGQLLLRRSSRLGAKRQSSSSRFEEAGRLALRSVVDPVLDVDVVRGGLVELRAEGTVLWCTVDVGFAAHPSARWLAEECSRVLSDIRGLTEIQVRATASGYGRSAGTEGLEKVASVVSVSSAKGGVGKSTVAANLARALRSKGARVGLADVDVEGPSIPTLFNCTNAILRPGNNDLIAPVRPSEDENLKLASVGFLKDDADLSALRGPLAGRVASQVVTRTDWGDLDVLVLDMPPGIGDVPLTLARDLAIHANVLVATPSAVARADVRRGLPLLQQFAVPTLALVNNMSYFTCSACTQKQYIFGEPSKNLLLDDLDGSPPAVFELPFSLAVRDTNEHTTVTDNVFEVLDGESRSAYLDLADHVVRTLLRDSYDHRDLNVDARFDKESRSLVVRRFDDAGASSNAVALTTLRDGIKDTVVPTRVAVIAKRAVLVDWSDGRRNDVFPLDRFFPV